MPQVIIPCSAGRGEGEAISRFGPVLRSLGIRYGYYNPKDWRQTMLIDPVVETWTEVINELYKIVVDDSKQDAIQQNNWFKYV